MDKKIGNEDVKKSAAELCDWFLKNYSEDSTARVSKEAFSEIVDALQKGASEKCLKEHTHPLLRMLVSEFDDKGVLLVMIELRSKALYMVKESKEAALKKLRSFPDSVPMDVRALFTASFLVTSRMSSLEELEQMNLKPFKIITAIRQKLEEAAFFEEADKATQHSAEA